MGLLGPLRHVLRYWRDLNSQGGVALNGLRSAHIIVKIGMYLFYDISFWILAHVPLPFRLWAGPFEPPLKAASRRIAVYLQHLACSLNTKPSGTTNGSLTLGSSNSEQGFYSDWTMVTK